ncbi:MAG: hypothetical protein H8D43_04280 [Chloroflexi bacterium]|nr:hypothetical protein [Chloroflexota bacterium]
MENALETQAELAYSLIVFLATETDCVNGIRVVVVESTIVHHKEQGTAQKRMMGMTNAPVPTNIKSAGPGILCILDQLLDDIKPIPVTIMQILPDLIYNGYRWYSHLVVLLKAFSGKQPVTPKNFIAVQSRSWQADGGSRG